MANTPKNVWYIGIIAVLLIGGVYFLLQKQTPTPNPKPAISRSKAPNVITNVVTSSSIDSKGNAVAPTTNFSKTEKTIYLVLTLNKPKVGTKVEYIRYLNNKLLDNNSLKLTKPDMTNASFAWSLKKPNAIRLVGNYKVKVYANGIFEKETGYTVK